MRKYIANTRDKGHGEFRVEMERLGYSVVDISDSANVADFICANADETILVELKVDLNSSVDISQLELFSTWKGDCMFAVSAEDTQTKPPLTNKQKDALAVLAIQKRTKTKSKAKRLTTSYRQVLKAIGEI